MDSAYYVAENHVLQISDLKERLLVAFMQRLMREKPYLTTGAVEVHLAELAEVGEKRLQLTVVDGVLRLEVAA